MSGEAEKRAGQDLAVTDRTGRQEGVGQRIGPGGAAQAAAGDSARDFRGTTIRLLGLLLIMRGRMLAIIVFSLVAVFLGALGPFFLGKATDIIVAGIGSEAGMDYSAIARVLLLVVGLQLASAAAQWVQALLTNDVVQAVSRDLRQKAEEKLGRVPLSWFDRQPHGEVLSRVTNDVDNVSQSLQQLLSQLLMSLFQVIGVVAMMAWLSPVLTVIALVSLALSMAVTRMLARFSQPRFRQQWKWTGILNGQIEEAYSGHALVKVFGRQKQALAAFANANDVLAENALKAQFLSGLIQPAIMFIGNLSFIAVVAFGAVRVLSGGLTIGTLQAFVQYIRQLNQPMSQVSSMAAILQSASASVERVFELLDAPEMSEDQAEARQADAVRGRVVFNHVHFRYLPDVPLFEDVSLAVEPGQMVAIVGPTGAGKTTLINLLMRFYEIDAGAITLDGIDIREMSREGLRRHFGMVLQDVWLFSGTIRENIAYGREGASEAEIMEAARACHVDDFVRTLPDGYDTRIDEDGAGLSVGQRQLLTIARAFLARPEVLILDEATSSVDTRTELLVQRAMGRLRQGRTSFVIAHRLSTIRDADLIVYMENGNVLEQGSHRELMARGGAFRALQMVQAPGAV